MKASTYVKVFVGLILFGTWLALVVAKVPGADDLISNIKLALLGLGVYHLNDRSNTP